MDVVRVPIDTALTTTAFATVYS